MRAWTDEIIARMLEVGLLDGNGRKYRPDMVRVGRGESIREVVKCNISLDARVTGLMKLDKAVLQDSVRRKREEYRLIHLKIQKRTHEMCLLRYRDQQQQQQHNQQHHHQEQQRTGRSHQSSQGHHQHHQPPHLHHHLNALAAPIIDLYNKKAAIALSLQRYTWVLSMYRPSVRPHSDQSKLEDDRKGRSRDSTGWLDRPREGSRAEVEGLLRGSFLDQAQIVFSTLSGAGSEMMNPRAGKGKGGGGTGRVFEAMVIDEAAQSVELSTLVALMHDTKHCVLVGDPRQLPATVFLQHSKGGAVYERSLFERLEQAGVSVHTLTVQYRMHPQISHFPARHFYHSQLRDGANVHTPSYSQPYHRHPWFRPFVFHDVTSVERREARSKGRGRNGPSSKSLQNVEEGELIWTMLQELFSRFYHPRKGAAQETLTPAGGRSQGSGGVHGDQSTEVAGAFSGDDGRRAHGANKSSGSMHAAAETDSTDSHAEAGIRPGDIGIITFYQQQKRLVQGLIQQRLPALLDNLDSQNHQGRNFQRRVSGNGRGADSTQPAEMIEVSTVDGFQGREKKIIIISCVRSFRSSSASSSSRKLNIGFVADIRRMNVALTRAKHALWIVGNARALQASSSSEWQALLQNAQQRQLIISHLRPARHALTQPSYHRVNSGDHPHQHRHCEDHLK